MMRSLTARVRREAFQPSWLGLLLSPVFILRRGLYIRIAAIAPGLHGRILDFGCGSKPYENLFVNAQQYLGCDIKTSGHRHADSRIDVFYDGKSLPFADTHFDAVVAFETFEHVFNLAEVLKEINRVTRKSGQLLMSVPFAWGEHEEPYDFARYTSFGITRVLNDAGYEIVEMNKTTSFVLAAAQLCIGYLASNVAPCGKAFYVFQLLLFFPMTVLAHLFDVLLPKRYQYYCNLVVLARKVR